MCIRDSGDGGRLIYGAVAARTMNKLLTCDRDSFSRISLPDCNSNAASRLRFGTFRAAATVPDGWDSLAGRIYSKGTDMRTYLLLLLAALVPAAAAVDSADFSNALAGAAKAFFLVAPVFLAVGSIIGLLARRRS